MAPVLRKRPASYADIEALPEHLVGEIIGGELYTSPRPAAPHIRFESGLMVLIGGPFQFSLGGPGGWWIFTEPELHLGKDVVVPDLAGWRKERMPHMPERAWFEVVPDWVCEVLSPSTQRLDRGEKLAVYQRERVGHVWLVDPVARTLEVYRWGEAGLVLLKVYTKEPRVRVAPFEAVELDLESLWGKEEEGEGERRE